MIMLKPMDKIRRLIEAKGWTQQEAAEAFDVSQATIFRWKEGKAEPEGPHRDRINAAYEQLIGLSPNSRDVMLPVGIPVEGVIQAGNWLDTSLVDDAPEDRPVLPIAADQRFPYAKQYALEVRGDSMNRVFADGGFVICVDYAQSGIEMRSDLIVHVEQWRHDLREITLKAMISDGDHWRLEPRSTNPVHKPIIMNGEPSEDTEVRVRGVVIGSYSRINI